MSGTERWLSIAVLAVASGGFVAAGTPDAAPTGRVEDPLAAFETFIGNWEFPDSFVAENPWAAEFHARSWAWGPAKAVVRLGETVHKETPDRRVFEGFAYWHPVERQVRFAGYNVQQKFYFEGHYEVLEPRHIVRQYNVYYPAEFEHDTFVGLTGQIRTFRGDLRILDDDTLEGTTYIRVDGRWQRWPTDDAPPFRLKRAPAESGK